MVLVQQKNGSWIEYKDLIEISRSGNLMIKVKLLSKALGFTYKKAMIATISSKPLLAYSAIIDSFTKNETHIIKEDKYVKIGDCKIKFI